jgi:hypothetical protein
MIKRKPRTPEAIKRYNDKSKLRPDYKDMKKNSYLKGEYGITLDDYNKMFADQNGCCAICNIHASMLTKSLYVDHSHETGEVRGLLCSECNLALGKFKDNITTLQNAIKYLGGNDGIR